MSLHRRLFIQICSAVIRSFHPLYTAWQALFCAHLSLALWRVTGQPCGSVSSAEWGEGTASVADPPR